MVQTPDPIRRGRSGDSKVPDFPSGSAKGSRGKYPKDSGGPPDAGPSSGGPSGSPFEIKAQPTPVERITPKQSPTFDASDPTR